MKTYGIRVNYDYEVEANNEEEAKQKVAQQINQDLENGDCYPDFIITFVGGEK